MSQYTSAEYANMHFIYGFCNGNANRAAALYQERYPNIRHPDYRVFIQVHNLLCEGRLRGTGLSGASEGRPQRHSVFVGVIDTGVKSVEVLELVEEDPSTSISQISRRTGIPKKSVHRILKRHQLYPYHYQMFQTLMPRYGAFRVTFCQIMLRKIIKRRSKFFRENFMDR
ncbi:unnamed protein product [Euphydryas editha]|uniref:DUF4817 domain-containing protein n=1 Tax=Euphydryas editha TaxID=104508 RepID=A0AAU9TVE4_EUPED|nr:unnamed protein product [Euphydryas editha]